MIGGEDLSKVPVLRTEVYDEERGKWNHEPTLDIVSPLNSLW